MKINFFQRKSKNIFDAINQIFRFFFPNDRKLKIETKTFWAANREDISLGWQLTKLDREFFTFRAIIVHYYYEWFINFYRKMKIFQHWNPKLIGQLGAIAFDATANGEGATTSISFSHTCTGTNLVLAAALSGNNAVDAFDTVTYNSVALTSRVAGNNGSNSARSEIWSLDDPSSGANTFSADKGGTGNACAGCTVSFSGADTFGATNTGTGTATTITAAVTTTRANSFVIDSVAHNWGGACRTNTVGANQTQRANICATGGAPFDSNYGFQCSTEQSISITSVTMSWTSDLDGENWHTSLLEIKEVVSSVGGGKRASNISLLRVGI